MTWSWLRGTVLVCRGDEVLLAESRGAADGSGRPNAPATRFQIASVSKQFTAAAVLLLAERSALDLDDPVGRWIPGCPPAWDGVTLRHLLVHRSGLPHWHDLPDARRAMYEPLTLPEQMDLFTHPAPRCAPGAEWYYSSPAYVLLAHTVQRAADQPYAEYLTDRILRPLGLSATIVGNGTGEPDRAQGYAGDEPVPSFELDAANIGAGDLWSTVGDVIRWNTALGTGDLLRAATRDLMLTRSSEHCFDDPPGWMTDDGYGLGWFIDRFAGHRFYAHPGDNRGFQSISVWFPDRDVRAVLLVNDETIEFRPALHDLLTAAVGA